jgi:1-hydroxycarotenoid 3,4-desaturase
MATVVIGAGVGGLSAAIALAAKGEQVTVLESQQGAGGKLLPVHINGASFDSGPTVLTMRWVFNSLFDMCGDRLDDHLTLHPLETLARHYWTGGVGFDLHSNQHDTTDAIGRFAGSAEAMGYKAFASDSRKIHQALLKPFLQSQRPTPWGLAAAMPLGEIFRINPFETLWHALGRYFKDPRLRQLFGRYATYCGSSPFKAPATLMLIADVEASGVWRIEGGMAKLAHSLQVLAQTSGAVFHFGVSAQRIEITGARVSAVIDGLGQRHPCTAVVVNADSAALVSGLFGADAINAGGRATSGDNSLSAITWCAQTIDSGVPLDHHTVFFSDNYETEFADLAHSPARDPTVYVCDQGEKRKLLLVNAPADGKPAARDSHAWMINRLSRSGLNLRLDERQTLQRAPSDFAELYPATSGALYGRATHGWMSTFLRPQAHTKIPGLFLAGGSTHPGPGVPMAALAGLRAAEALLQDRASTRPWHQTAIAGGTLMR